ncbi:MAG: hypothetical protein FJW66_09135 [Actinobacteria bacterium]|nr:hypothetical protein [Actinomycetota bacterium]
MAEKPDIKKDNIRIRNIAIISVAAIAAIEVICFILYRTKTFDIRTFYGLLTSGLLTFIFFIATLIVYMRAAHASVQSRLKYLMAVLFAKIVVSAVAFYLVYNYVNIMVFLFSFLIFFTIFFNLEIFLIYRRVLYYKQ